MFDGQEVRLKALLNVATAILVVASPPAAAQMGPRTTGLFSNLSYNEEGGDLLGMEVCLMLGAKGGQTAVVQCAGGEPSDPVVVKARLEGARLSFVLPAGLPECGTEFEGVVSADGLRGRFAGETADRWLLRKKGYWQ